MQFIIKIGKEKISLMLKRRNQSLEKIISARQKLSQNLLLAIDGILRKAKVKTLPLFKVICIKDKAFLSCNIARATAQALNFPKFHKLALDKKFLGSKIGRS